ncbi:MAG: hypothetical protein ACYDCM_00645 [Candidatus Acidiferrales bacterium]
MIRLPVIRLQIVTEKWNPISAAIRFSTRSWASHAEFIDVTAQVTLGARCAGGVKIRPCAKDHYSRVEQFIADGIMRAYAWALTQAGKPYDFSAITGIALDRNLHDESRWFCSELVAVAFEKAGYPLLSTRPSAAPWRITPRDLLLSRSLCFLAGTGMQ